MMWPISSISSSSRLDFSGSAPIATEKNTAKITICRISFCAIASAIEVGIRWVRNFSSEKAETGRPVDCALSGSVPGKFAPGCSRFTITRPSISETKEALMNQPMVLAKMRPSLAPEPICAMPPTRVANTRGAMIILIRRRNSIAIRLMLDASSARWSGRKLKISEPVMMPSTIAPRIYCVNLFDMREPPSIPAQQSLADFVRHATRFQSPQCSRCERRALSLAYAQCTKRDFARFIRVACINNHQTIEGKCHDRRHRQPPDPAGREAQRKARPGPFQADLLSAPVAFRRRGAGEGALHLARCRQPRVDAWRDLS